MIRLMKRMKTKQVTLRLAKIMIREDDQESDMEYDRGSDKNSDQKYDQGSEQRCAPSRRHQLIYG